MLVDPLTQLLPAMLGLLVATLYLAAAARLQASPGPWPRRRTASFLAGVVVIAGGVIVPGSLGATGHDPRVHMTAHLMIGMMGPLLIAVSGPVTLAFRTLRRPGRRRLAAVLGTRAVRFLGHPMTAVVLSVGGLWALYLTPLHAQMVHNPLLGLLIQAHVVLAGTLYAWSIVGVDQVPRRPSVQVRGAALLVGVLLHTILSRLLFADAERLAAEAGGTVAEWSTAAEIMWFEGDLVELAFVLVFFAQIAGRRHRGRSVATVPATGRAVPSAAFADDS